MGSIQQVMMTLVGVAAPSPQVEFDGRNLTDADAAPITLWVDSSGNGRDATPGAGGPKVANPGLNGLPVSRWDGGAGDQLNFTGNAITDTFTVISVMKCTDSNTRTILAEGTGADGPPRYHINSNKQELAEDDNITFGPSTTALNTTDFYTVAVSHNGVSGAIAFYLNGSADGTTTSTVPTFTKRFGRIGCRSGNQNTFLGDIAYVAYWDTVLSGGDLTTIFDDLRAVWGHY